ncbi:MAG: AtpZ/AtpI family protein [Bacteroidota bacterium]|nr:AtpZ/AtpI family protein [Bacteroidota bacterium]
MTKKNDDDLNKFTKYYKDVGPYLGLGMQLAVTVTVMVFVGVWLDKQTGNKPLFTVVFALLGVFAGLYNFLKSVLSADKKTKDDDKK